MAKRSAQTPLRWIREAGPRVAGSRDLDRSKVQAPGIVRDPSGGYRLFYTAIGSDRPFEACQGSIFSAFSNDGLNFVPDDGIRVAPDPAVPDRSLRVLAPSVTQVEDRLWRMYFESRGPADRPTLIGSARSTDLLEWEVEEGARLASAEGVGGPRYVSLGDGRGRLYYSESYFDGGGLADGQRMSQSIISAVTTDGLHFERELGDRMQDRYSEQEDVGITAADVMVPANETERWWMLYSAWQDVPAGTQKPLHPSNDPQAVDRGTSADFAVASIASDMAGYRSRIFAASSDDGLSWTREGCVIEGEGHEQAGIDAVHAEDMSVIRLDDGGYRMYYAACDRAGNWCIASAKTG